MLTALSELDFDYTLGKIPEEDYPVQRTVLLQKGAGLLRQLDDLDTRGGCWRCRRAIGDSNHCSPTGNRPGRRLDKWPWRGFSQVDDASISRR